MRGPCRIDLDRLPELHERLRAFAARLRECLPVERVLVHGSFATGELHELSDIDLVIVGDFGERIFDRIGRVLELRPKDLPIEPLCYTPAEFEAMIRAHNPFIRQVLATGQDL